MIIGIDASRANKDRKTGTEWYAYSLIRWFAQIDKKNEYILYTDKPLTGGLLDLTDKQYDYNDERFEQITLDGKGFQKIKSPHDNFKAKVLKWPFKYFWTQGRLSFEMLFNKIDILFVPSHALPIIHPPKSIVTIHDVGFDRFENVYENTPIAYDKPLLHKVINFFTKILTRGKYNATKLDYLRWSTEYAIKHASKIITVSNFSKKELSEIYNTHKQNIQVIHNGFNNQLYTCGCDQEKIKQIKEKYGIDSDYLLYVGRLERKKNTPAMIEAFAIMKDKCQDIKHKLVIIGEASYGYDEVNYMMNEFGIENDVIILGWINEVDLPCVYEGATAFVFPSVYEGFGIPLLQAMACRVPIIASDSSSIPEVVEDSALLFNPHFVVSMASAMEKIIKDEEVRNDLIKKGERRVASFSWQKTAQETLNAILQ